jgi:diphthamide synthase (EF-2-diphthine--ammonia ligase)
MSPVMSVQCGGKDSKYFTMLCIHEHTVYTLIPMMHLDWSVACKYLAHQPHIKCNNAGCMDTAIKILDERFQYTY